MRLDLGASSDKNCHSIAAEVDNPRRASSSNLACTPVIVTEGKGGLRLEESSV
jgi:hypothetical protein